MYSRTDQILPIPSAPPDMGNMPPPYNQNQQIEPIINKGNVLSGFCAEHKIAPCIQEDLSILENYEIVIICDDSSSMLTPTENGTRWTELKAAVEIIVQFGGILDEDGVDIWFLNRSDLKYLIKTSELLIKSEIFLMINHVVERH